MKLCRVCGLSKLEIEFVKRYSRKGFKNICKECNKKWKREYLQKQRMKLFNILGGAFCVVCSFKDIRCLQFDHKDGGGLKDLERFGNVYHRLVNYYIKHPNEAKEKLQVLCANHNWIKKCEQDEHTNIVSRQKV